MRLILSVLFVLAGCATTGTGSGFSGEQENRLRSIGPELNRQFSLAGNSIDMEPGRRFTILIRDDSFLLLGEEESKQRARAIAQWVWDRYGKDAGMEVLTITTTGDGPGRPKRGVYRFVASELDEKAPGSGGG